MSLVHQRKCDVFRTAIDDRRRFVVTVVNVAHCDEDEPFDRAVSEYAEMAYCSPVIDLSERAYKRLVRFIERGISQPTGKRKADSKDAQGGTDAARPHGDENGQ